MKYFLLVLVAGKVLELYKDANYTSLLFDNYYCPLISLTLNHLYFTSSAPFVLSHIASAVLVKGL
jgi:hypothetical protein